MAALLTVAGALGGLPVGARTLPQGDSTPPADSDPVDAQLRVMEQALDEAVGRAMRTIEQQLPTLAPGLLFFTGSIQTRGFALEGYGLFFDVEYPPLRRSILWSMGALNQLNANMAQFALANAIATVRRQMQSTQDGPARAALTETLEELESQIRPSPATSVALDGRDLPQSGPADAEPPPGPVDPAALIETYETALIRALTDALLGFGTSASSAMLLESEWVTVAARDGRRLSSNAGPRRTLQLRVGVRDLLAFRRGQISADALRARVDVR